ncbi:MAG: hypothetical protein EHM61_05765 [Acidobacteria bacterium]|nr:MAG: hypothetical protein EHM61_05765 [Acidobacteriota bacterium]
MANQDTFNNPTKSTTPTGEQAAEKASGMVEEGKRKAAEMSARAKEQLNRAMETGKTKADQARVSAAGGLQRAASTVQDTATRLPGGERVQGAVRSVGTGMERTATYLREHDFNDMQSDVENVVRRHPGKSLITALAAGFLLGQAIRRSRH